MPGFAHPPCRVGKASAQYSKISSRKLSGQVEWKLKNSKKTEWYDTVVLKITKGTYTVKYDKDDSVMTHPLRGQPVYGGKTFSGKKCPVKRNTFGRKEPMN